MPEMTRRAVLGGLGASALAASALPKAYPFQYGLPGATKSIIWHKAAWNRDLQLFASLGPSSAINWVPVADSLGGNPK